MRIVTAFFVILFSVTILGSAQGQRPLKIVTYDSLAVDSIQVPQIVENPTSVLGFANNSNVVLNNTSYFVLAQFYHGSVTPVEFQQGAKIEFYWQRGQNDSSRAWFVLRHYIVNAN
jgi:hypothetical protein